jgi:hypothetical protein
MTTDGNTKIFNINKLETYERKTIKIHEWKPMNKNKNTRNIRQVVYILSVLMPILFLGKYV